MAVSYFCSHCGAENMPGDALCHACQQPLTLPTGNLEATTLLNERYELLMEVGSGGFGAVYKARDTLKSARLVAVKQINLKGLSSQEIIEATDAFNREAEILTSLSHPLLPRIYDRFSDPDHWYLVMNFIDGQTLDDYLEQQVVSALPDRRGLSLDETLAFGLRLCDVLHYLHSQQPSVIFRDLKPGNIMHTTRGDLYLIDFGIARRFKPGQAKDTIPFGSPGFAAPEQYGRIQTTPQADIYSLGALFYCLISGDDPSEHPFQFPPLRLPHTDGLRELETLISRMVALEPARRPADIQVVRTELQRIQHMHIQASQRSRIWTPPQGQTPSANNSEQQHIFQAPPSTAQVAPARKTTRRRVLTVGLIAGSAAIVGGIAYINANQGQPNAKNSALMQDAEATATAQSMPTAVAGDQSIPIFTFWSSDLTHSAAVIPNDASSTNEVKLYADQGQRLLQTIGNLDYDPGMFVRWSLNNERIFLGASSGDSSALWDVQSGHQLFALQLSGMDSNDATMWSPDGNYLAIGSSAMLAFLIINTANGQTFWPQSSPAQIPTSLAWIPDSHYLLVPFVNSANSNTWTIEIWESQTPQKIGVIVDALPLDASMATIPSLACSPSGRQYAFSYQNFLWTGNLSDPHSAHQLTSFTDEIPWSDELSMEISSLVWSPNEHYLAILFAGTLSIWSVSTGQSVRLSSNNSQGNINAFVWAADSKSVTVADAHNLISHWSIG